MNLVTWITSHKWRAKKRDDARFNFYFDCNLLENDQIIISKNVNKLKCSYFRCVVFPLLCPLFFVIRIIVVLHFGSASHFSYVLRVFLLSIFGYFQFVSIPQFFFGVCGYTRIPFAYSYFVGIFFYSSVCFYLFLQIDRWWRFEFDAFGVITIVFFFFYIVYTIWWNN